MGLKAILFDCDGVLIDSEPMGCEALAIAMTNAGYPMDRHEAARAFSGSAAKDSRALMTSCGVDADQVYAQSDAILFEMFDRNIPLIEGIESLLAEVPLMKAVCSNSSVHRLDVSIRRTSLAPYFDHHIYSGDSVPAPKPAPDLALFAAARLGVHPSETIFIDDNIQGVRCGRDAGCISVGFIGPSEHRMQHEKTLLDAGAHYVVRSMAEFQKLIQSLTLPLTA
jgi:HAD superfamily hydrolase (TIGR01509 family)